MKNDQPRNESMPYITILFVIIIALIIFFGFAVLSLKSQGSGSQGSGTKMNALTISASGTVANTTSQAVLYASINGTGQTNQLAVENLSGTLNEFNSTILKYVNGNASRISTSYFNVYKIYNKSGYSASESVDIIIPNISNVSKAIGALSSIPNVYVTDTISQLSGTQIGAMRTRALSLALANATAQADALIGNNSTVYSTNITINSYYVYPYSYSSGAGAVPAGITTTVPPQYYGGSSTVTESITVVFIYGKKS